MFKNQNPLGGFSIKRTYHPGSGDGSRQTGVLFSLRGSWYSPFSIQMCTPRGRIWGRACAWTCRWPFAAWHSGFWDTFRRGFRCVPCGQQAMDERMNAGMKGGTSRAALSAGRAVWYACWRKEASPRPQRARHCTRGSASFLAISMALRQVRSKKAWGRAACACVRACALYVCVHVCACLNVNVCACL